MAGFLVRNERTLSRGQLVSSARMLRSSPGHLAGTHWTTSGNAPSRRRRECSCWRSCSCWNQGQKRPKGKDPAAEAAWTGGGKSRQTSVSPRMGGEDQSDSSKVLTRTSHTAEAVRLGLGRGVDKQEIPGPRGAASFLIFFLFLFKTI